MNVPASLQPLVPGLVALFVLCWSPAHAGDPEDPIGVPGLVLGPVTPAGNLRLDVRGGPGIPLEVEVSPDLRAWFPATRVTPATGAETLFLRPTASRLYCRVRTLAPDETAGPARFQPTVNPDFVRTLFLDDAGGSMGLEDDRGFTYTVSIPDGAVVDSGIIGLRVVDTASGLPPGLTYLGGVTMERSGETRVYEGSTLTVKMPGDVGITNLVGLVWEPGGGELHLAPISVEGSTVRLPMRRLGGCGLARWNGGDLDALVNSRPTETGAMFEHQLARMAMIRPGARLAARPSPAADPCAQAGVWELFGVARHAELEAAVANDALLEQALHDYAPMGAIDGFSGTACFDAVRRLADACDELAVRALLASVDREAEICRTRRDLRAVVRLYRDAKLLRAGRWSRKVSPGDMSRVRDLLHACLHFRVEILSSTAVGTRAGTVRTSVSSDFEIGHVPVPATVRPGMFQIAGEADLTIDSTHWDDPTSGCTPEEAPAPGHLRVYHLGLEGLITDVRHLVVRSDEELPEPKLQLGVDPFLPPPSEHFTLRCPPAPPLPFPASFWGVAFGALHRAELGTTHDRRSIYWIQGLRSATPTEPHRRDYLTEGRADALQVGETTTFFVHYLGVR